jgi:hypothetical protein
MSLSTSDFCHSDFATTKKLKAEKPSSPSFALPVIAGAVQQPHALDQYDLKMFIVLRLEK